MATVPRGNAPGSVGTAQSGRQRRFFRSMPACGSAVVFSRSTSNPKARVQILLSQRIRRLTPRLSDVRRRWLAKLRSIRSADVGKLFLEVSRGDTARDLCPRPGESRSAIATGELGAPRQLFTSCISTACFWGLYNTDERPGAGKPKRATRAAIPITSTSSKSMCHSITSSPPMARWDAYTDLYNQAAAGTFYGCRVSEVCSATTRDGNAPIWLTRCCWIRTI